MPAKVADVADFDGEVVARLPLNVERLVERVRQLVVAVVIAEREERNAGCDCGRIRQNEVGGIARRSGPERGAPRGFEIAAIRISIRTASL